MTENYWLKKLEKTYAHQSGLVTGIGDDAAVWEPNPDELILMSADMLTGGVHFDLNTHTPELIGRKALAVNLSDMAAMGGVPKIFTVSMGIPKGFLLTDLDRLYQGLDALAKEFDVILAGGDTTTTKGPLVLSVAITGETVRKKRYLRSGAKSGDMIFVTGTLGGSFESGRHLSFTPRVRESLLLTERFTVHSMMDLSDGLAGDLRRLCEASGKGAVLDADAVPVSADIASGSEPLKRAFTDGEDFELLFTVPKEDGLKLLREKALYGVPVSHIGTITEEQKLLLKRSGKLEPLKWQGYEHRF